GRDAAAEERRRAPPRQPVEPLVAGGPGGPDRRVDAAAGSEQRLVRGAARPQRVLGDAAAVPHEVRVAVDEAGQHAAPAQVDPRQRVRLGRRLGGPAHPAEAPAVDDERRVLYALVRRVELRDAGDEAGALASVHDLGEDTPGPPAPLPGASPARTPTRP